LRRFAKNLPSRFQVFFSVASFKDSEIIFQPFSEAVTVLVAVLAEDISLGSFFPEKIKFIVLVIVKITVIIELRNRFCALGVEQS